MKVLHHLLFASLCAFLLASSGMQAHAQSFYEVEGVVYGPNSTPAKGMAVFLEDLTRSRIGQTITDSDGRYRFSRVEAGTYYIVIKPNDRQLQSAVHRLELINTARFGSNSSVERLDITLAALARPADAASRTLFAQDVPPSAAAEYDRATDSLAKKNNELAIRQLHAALKIFPDYFMANQQLGLLYVENEEYQKAIALLVKAIEVNANAGPSYLALGIASLRLGRADLALDALERARRIDQKSFRVHFFLGLALLDLNRLDEAERSLKEAYNLGGADKAASARLHLASIYSKQGKSLEAINELEAYLRDHPKAANAASVREAISKLKTKL
jgi:tetratricopeptide (TPR) repeat protein